MEALERLLVMSPAAEGASDRQGGHADVDSRNA
jgi:hypothetical protein